MPLGIIVYKELRCYVTCTWFNDEYIFLLATLSFLLPVYLYIILILNVVSLSILLEHILLLPVTTLFCRLASVRWSFRTVIKQ